MYIKNHKLIGAKQLKTPHQSGVLRSIDYIVLHEDEGASMAGTESWIMDARSKVSYHALVGNNGEVTQFVDFNKRAYHAGKSAWKGLTDLNWYSIGVSFQNRNGEAFTQGELNRAVEVCKLLIAEYPTIKEIVRHRDISPGRKSDPHLGFPFDWFKQQVFGSEIANNIVTKEVTAALNLREGSGTTYRVITTLPKGAKVHVLSETQNGWAEVLVCDTNRTGWVSAKYLK